MAVTFRVPDMALAYEFLEGAGPVVVFCPGFASDMGGTKAMALWEMCRARGQAMLRFDYGGHGQSAGAFEDGCIGDWAADAAHVVEVATAGRELLLVGSSMGGWIALLLARALAQVRAMVLVAPAPDFTELLMKPLLGEAEWAELRAKGVIYQPSEYGAPTPLTLKLLEDGARNLVLEAPIGFNGPVRVLHGMRDADVPWRHSLLLAERLASEDVRLVFVKDGDHRLSREGDLALLCASVGAFLGEDGG
ncbi:alpha/beta hydrolase [Acidocella aquatica]|uniref:Alpha/beta hydrolase n=1 Tax=Acidocella aquatica TaxID=1922313 RepID=A0ABQ6A6K3_9PROT|nr:alpha/beta hydrolase [Acidocella aquatica]GLR65823.1 alpha/beta hydrolase [Acidocella aquatica]